jgi:glycosyltransferase involved in cell wall biosynthesis
MINILYVIWSLGLGGAEQVVISLAKGLDRSKFRPVICCLNDEGIFAGELKKDGIEVFAIKKAKGLDFSVVPKLVKIIRENNIRIVHAHLWGANFWGRFAAKAAKVPVVVTEHNVDVWKSPFHFWIDRYLFKGTSCFIAVSETVRGFYAEKLGVAKEKIRVVYNGISTVGELRVASCELKKEFGIREGEKVVSVIGRLVAQKGVGFFLETFSKMAVDKVKVLIVGEGPEKKVLELRVSSCELKNKVVFTGFRRDVKDILGITDILVLPSTREGLPMILLEAMAAGAIVVATRVGGTPELVTDGVNGFLVASGDGDGLRKKLEFVLSASATNDEIRRAAKKTVEEKFSLQRMVMEYEAIYGKVLENA